jgi:DTW domain-containing protein
MSARKKAGRCEGCGLHEALCACDRFPVVEVRTPIVLVQHMRERGKPSNTGRLLQRMVPSIPITHFGQREPPFDATPLERPGVKWYVLFPREDSIELGPQTLATWRAEGQQVGFVVLDGTWHQCSRMARRVPGVTDLPCVALPPGPPSRWEGRTQHDPRGLCTFEAGLRLLSLTEGEAVAGPLRAAFHVLAARLSFMKGRLRTPEVPENWQHDATWSPDP